MSQSQTANAAQSAYWNEGAGPTWAELTDLLDRQLEAIGAAAIEALSPRPGERLADIGCGAGATTVALAERVGPAGGVLGVDISRPLLDLARTRAVPPGAAAPEFLEGDAQVHAFEPGALDGVYSRFGVMFFEDPIAAFANLRAALKPGGRLVFACWRSPADNPLMSAPMAAVAHHVPAPPPPPSGAPGPFAFADPERVRAILAEAGFTDIAVAPRDIAVGGNSLEDSLTLALRVGPLGAMIREHPEVRTQVIDEVRATLGQWLTDGRVVVDGGVWMVSARRP